MGTLVLRVIEFGMPHAAAGAHALHVARTDHAAGAHAVLVREFTFEHVADDFHVLVAVRPETRTGRDPVFIDHAQGAEAHVLRVVTRLWGNLIRLGLPWVT